MHSLIQATPAYELSVDIATSAHGHSLRLISFVPTARRPEHQVKFQGVFGTAELKSLRDALTQALEADFSRLTPDKALFLKKGLSGLPE